MCSHERRVERSGNSNATFTNPKETRGRKRHQSPSEPTESIELPSKQPRSENAPSNESSSIVITQIANCDDETCDGMPDF